MVQNTQQNNKRIAKNTMFLYIRMFIMLIVGLFTSRVILDALGETDYGIYNIIGGVVVLFSFLNQALTSATQRFLNFNLGKGNMEQVERIFCMSMNSYIILSAVFVVAAETIGLWFVNTQLNIPSERMSAANWVYQFTILTFIINLIRIPYNASIIAYEHMNFFAYVSFIEVIFKLIVIYVLFIKGIDRLIVFALLYTLIPFCINWVYKIYCDKKFTTTHYHLMWDKNTFFSLFNFSGWSLFGSLANVSVNQGLNIIVNVFFGVTVNAALGIANQVSSQINQFVSNFQTAFNPQLVKLYAQNELKRFYRLICVSSRFSYYLLLTISLPVFFTIETILKIWLKNVPHYTADFCRLILIFSLINALAAPLWLSVQATGKIKTYQILMSVILIINLPLSWICLKMGFAPMSVWIVRVLVEIIVNVARLSYMRSKMKFPVRKFIKDTILPVIKVTVLALPVPLLAKIYMEGYWMKFFTEILSCLVISIILIYYLGITKSERNLVVTFIKQKINKR